MNMQKQLLGTLTCKSCQNSKKLRSKGLCNDCWNLFCNWYRTGITNTRSRANINKKGRKRPTNATTDDVARWIALIEDERSMSSTEEHEMSANTTNDRSIIVTLQLAHLEEVTEEESPLLAQLSDIISAIAQAGETLGVHDLRIGPMTSTDRLTIHHLAELLCRFGVLIQDGDNWQLTSEIAAQELAIRLRGGGDEEVAKLYPSTEELLPTEPSKDASLTQEEVPLSVPDPVKLIEGDIYPIDQRTMDGSSNGTLTNQDINFTQHYPVLCQVLKVLAELDFPKILLLKLELKSLAQMQATQVEEMEQLRQATTAAEAQTTKSERKIADLQNELSLLEKERDCFKGERDIAISEVADLRNRLALIEQAFNKR